MNKKNVLIFQASFIICYVGLALLLFERFTLALFVTGLVAGMAFSWLDAKFLYPHYKDKTVHSTDQYITRSLLFLLAYLATSFFVVTSTRSALGMGLSLGIGLVAWSELLFTLASPAQLNSLLGVKKPFKKNELELFVAGYSAVYIVMAFMTFFN